MLRRRSRPDSARVVAASERATNDQRCGAPFFLSYFSCRHSLNSRVADDILCVWRFFENRRAPRRSVLSRRPKGPTRQRSALLTTRSAILFLSCSSLYFMFVSIKIIACLVKFLFLIFVLSTGFLALDAPARPTRRHNQLESAFVVCQFGMIWFF